jgi:hypothetical protein
MKERLMQRRPSVRRSLFSPSCVTTSCVAALLISAPAWSDDGVKPGRGQPPEQPPMRAPTPPPAMPRDITPPPAPKFEPPAPAPAPRFEPPAPTPAPRFEPPAPAPTPRAPKVEPPLPAPRAPKVEPPVSTPRAPKVEPPVSTPRAPKVEPPVSTPRAPKVEPPVSTPRAPKVEPPISTPRAPKVEPPVAPSKPRPGSIDDDAPIRRPNKPAVEPNGPRTPDVRKPEVDRPTVKRPEVQRPDAAKPDRGKPAVSPTEPGPRSRPDVPSTKTPTTRDIVTKRPTIDGGATRTNPDVSTRPTRFVSDTVGGVRVSNRPVDGSGGGNTTINNTTINQTVINNNYNQYINSVSYANGWHPNSHWSSAGPCHVWQPYTCSSGLSVSVGFGSGGFSFGLYFGSSGAPLCSSWYNPWWDGYASCWTCAPTYSAWPTPWRSPHWRAHWPVWSCWEPYRPWWHHYYPYGPCPQPAFIPCYTYSPFVCSTVIYAPPVVVVQPPPPPALPNPNALWTFLAEGYDDDAESGFVVLGANDPNEGTWIVGKAFARAFRGETARASDTLRDAFLRDPAGILSTSADPRFVARLDALERSLAQLAGGPRPSVDALVVIAASQAARGDLSGAYFSATSAQAEGDRTAGTASFVSWLRTEIRARGTP